METFLQELSADQSALVSSIIINEENNMLHDWQRKNIIIAQKVRNWAMATTNHFESALFVDTRKNRRITARYSRKSGGNTSRNSRGGE